MKTGKTADVVVIGGGVIGTAIAYFLVRNNMDVILVDKGAITAGTSGRCEGDVLVCDKVPGFDSRLTKLSQDLFPEIANELDYDISWTRKGSLLAIENEKSPLDNLSRGPVFSDLNSTVGHQSVSYLSTRA